MTPRYVDPAGWGATSVGVKPKIPTPVADVFVHHTVTDPTLDPVADAKKVEDIGIERFGRLSYSWMIHPNGTVLEGQGVYRGAHSVDERVPGPNGNGLSRNYDSFGIAAIGDFTQYPPSPEMIASYVWLIARLRTQSLLKPDHGVHPHNLLKATACPGSLADHIPTIIERLKVPPMPDLPDPPTMEERIALLERKVARTTTEVDPRQAAFINGLQTRMTNNETSIEELRNLITLILHDSGTGLLDRVIELEEFKAAVQAL